jgi:hypothetical protein
MGFVLEMKIYVGKRKVETAPKKMRRKMDDEITGYEFCFEVCI